MPLMPTGKREQSLIFVALLAVAAIAAYWYLVFNKKSVDLSSKSDHLEQMVTANEKARREVAKGSVDQLRVQVAQYRQSLTLIRTLVPTTHEVPALLEQVSTAARREGLEIAGVDPQPVINGEGYDTYRYDIGVVGGYHALASFLTNVGSLTRIVAPVNLKLIPPSNGQVADKGKAKGKTLIEARFQIQTYVAHGPSADDDAPASVNLTKRAN